MCVVETAAGIELTNDTKPWTGSVFRLSCQFGIRILLRDYLGVDWIPTKEGGRGGVRLLSGVNVRE